MIKRLRALLKGLKSLRKSPELIYSLSLIVIIPGLLIINTYIIVTSFNDVVNFEIRDKAGLAASLLKETFQDSDPETAQSKINNISRRTTDSKGYQYFRQLDYLTKTDEDFNVVASNERERIGQKIQPQSDSNTRDESFDSRYYTQINLSWAERQDIVISVFNKEEPGYLISTLVTDSNGKRAGIVYAFVSYKHIGILNQEATNKGLLVLAISVLVVLLLLLNRSRVYQYSTLFKQLKQVDEMKDDFISIASHELRTPLTSIKGNLSLLLEEHGLSEEQRDEILKNAAASTQQLTELVGDLLDVSRIEQNRLQLVMEEVDLNEFMQKIIEELKVQADQKGLELTFAADKTLPRIRSDKTKLRQVFINLIGNAIKYTEKGSVAVSAETDENAVSVLIRDTGIGMTPEQRAKLFDKFYRIRTTQTQNITGTGLGLWITRQLIEKMGGEIYVDSIEGSGTQIKFTIPLAKPQKP